MMLRMTVRDCLYLNWALPVEKLPEPPAPLRYQLHSWQGRDHVFASALLFHQDAVHFASLPRLRVGYPQLDLRLCVLDAQGIPSVLFRRMLMPAWVTPGVRLLTHHPASRARLDFPRPSRDLGEGGPWTWKVERGGSLEVRAWQHSPQVGEGPRLGNWEQTVRYFEERPRGYTEGAGTLHRIEAGVPQAACWPLRVELHGDDVLSPWLCLEQNGSAASWPQVHSAWLCPEVPFVFELGLVPQIHVTPSVPSPAAGRMAAPVLRSGVFRPKELEGTPPERQRVAC
jgi:hypothetical protein